MPVLRKRIEGQKKTPASLGKAGVISRPWSARSIADRDAANARTNGRIDELLGDVAVGSDDSRGRYDADAPAIAAMEMAVTMATVHMSGSRGRDQSGGTNRNDGTKGEGEFAEHDGSPVSRTWGCSGCGCHILNLGRRRPGKGSKPVAGRAENRRVTLYSRQKRANAGSLRVWLAEPRPKRGNWRSSGGRTGACKFPRF